MLAKLRTRETYTIINVLILVKLFREFAFLLAYTEPY